MTMPLTGAGAGGISTPADLPDLALWLKDAGTFQDAGGTTPATADADPVGRWSDQSGNARHATQSSAGARPLLKLAVQNGLNVVRFDGTDDFILTADFGLAQPVTLFLVAKVTSGGDLTVLIDGRTADSMEVRRKSGDATALDVYAGSFLTQSLPANAGSFQQLTVAWNGASSQVWQNGASKAAGNAGTASPLGVVLAANGSGGGRYLACDFGEVVAYARALSGVERANVEGYLRTRWGTP